MAYTFIAEVEKEKSRLTLMKDGKKVSGREWEEGRDMGKRLFQAIEDLLQENSLNPKEISDFVVESTVPEGNTSLRIAETVKKVYTFGVGARLQN